MNHAKILAVFLAVVLAVAFVPMVPPPTAHAESFGAASIESEMLGVASGPQDATDAAQELQPTHNLWKHDYDSYGKAGERDVHTAFWAVPAKSHLHVNGNGRLERVEYVGGELIVEEVGDDFKSASSHKVIDASTYQPSGLTWSGAFAWGGFFSGSQYNFVACAQQTEERDNDRAMYRISKYSKNWEYLNCCEIKGIDTYNALDSGFLDMCELDGLLYVRTSQQQVFEPDKQIHQTNVQFVIDEETMSARPYRENGSINWVYGSGAIGAVSHSFNQLLVTLGDKVYGVDHGDAVPRSVCVKDLYAYQDGPVDVFPIAGDQGDNYTGVKLGGLEASASENALVTAFSSADQNAGRLIIEGNIYVAITPAQLYEGSADSGGRVPVRTELKKLTDYRDGDEMDEEVPGTVIPSAPFLVKLSDERFLVMWSESVWEPEKIIENGRMISNWKQFQESNTVKYAFIDIDGQTAEVGDVQSCEARLSDCQPIVFDGKVVWYAGDGEVGFYSIDAQDGTFAKVESIEAVEFNFESGMGRSYWIDDDVEGFYGTHRLVKGTDYKEESIFDRGARTITITVTGLGDRSGTSKTFTYPLTFGAISSKGITIQGPAPIYDGKEKRPTLRVEDRELVIVDPLEGSVETGRSFPLEEGRDYRIVGYKDNVNPGEATVTIEGLGFYSGETTASFPITCPASKLTVSGLEDRQYHGDECGPAPTVKLGDKVLVPGRDYTVSYKDNVNAGTAKVVVQGKGYYTGTKTATFRITPAPISEHVLWEGLDPWESYTYTGRPIKAKPLMDSFVTTNLVEGKDYDIQYKNNVNAGTAMVLLVGKGNYTGSVSDTFTIDKAPATVTVKKTSAKVKKKAVKKKAQSFKIGAKASSGGKLTYKVLKNKHKKTLSFKSGKVTLKRKARKGTYSMKVRVTSKATANYMQAYKDFTLKFVVK